jgi:hypothetical protein
LGKATEGITHFNLRRDQSNDSREAIRRLVTDCRDAGAAATRRAEQLVDNAEKQGQGRIASTIGLIDSTFLASAFAAVTRSGLKSFHPDVFGPVSSPYNQLHRHLAVSTFTQIALWFGLTNCAVSLTYAQDSTFLYGVFDHYVFNTLRDSSLLALNKGAQHVTETAVVAANKKRRETVCAFSAHLVSLAHLISAGRPSLPASLQGQVPQAHPSHPSRSSLPFRRRTHCGGCWQAR